MSKSLCLISCLIAGLTLAEEVVVDDYLAPE